MSYSKYDLIKKLIAFKEKHGELPTRQDFKEKKSCLVIFKLKGDGFYETDYKKK